MNDDGVSLLQQAKQIIVSNTSTADLLQRAYHHLHRYYTCHGHTLRQRGNRETQTQTQTQTQLLNYLKIWYNLTLRFLTLNQLNETLDSAEYSLRVLGESEHASTVQQLTLDPCSSSQPRLPSHTQLQEDMRLMFAWACCIKGRCLAMLGKENASEFTVAQVIPVIVNFHQANPTAAAQMATHGLQALHKVSEAALKRDDRQAFVAVVRQSQRLLAWLSASQATIVLSWIVKLLKLSHMSLQSATSTSAQKAGDSQEQSGTTTAATTGSETDESRDSYWPRYEKCLQEFHQYSDLAFQLTAQTLSHVATATNVGSFLQAWEDFLGVCTWVGLLSSQLRAYPILWAASLLCPHNAAGPQQLKLVRWLNEFSRLLFQHGYPHTAASVVQQSQRCLNQLAGNVDKLLLMDTKLTEALVVSSADALLFVQSTLSTLSQLNDGQSESALEDEKWPHLYHHAKIHTLRHLSVLCFNQHHLESALLLAEACATEICDFNSGSPHSSTLTMKFIPATLLEYSEVAECFLLLADLYTTSGRVFEAQFFVEVLQQYLSQLRWLPSPHYATLAHVASARLLSTQQRFAESLETLKLRVGLVEVLTQGGVVHSQVEQFLTTYHDHLDLLTKVFMEYGDASAELRRACDTVLKYFGLAKKCCEALQPARYLPSDKSLASLCPFKVEDLEYYPQFVVDVYIVGVMLRTKALPNEPEGLQRLHNALQHLRDGTLPKSLGYFMLGMFRKCQVSVDSLWNLQQKRPTQTTPTGKQESIQEVQRAFWESYRHQRWMLRVPETKKVCLALGSVCGRVHPLAATFYLNMTLGNTFHHQMTSAQSYYSPPTATASSPATRKKKGVQISPLRKRLQSVSHAMQEILTGGSSSSSCGSVSQQQPSDKDALLLMSYLTTKLPEDYVVCTLCLSEDRRSLYVTRIERHVSPSVVMALPISTSDINIVEDALQQIAEILAQDRSICASNLKPEQQQEVSTVKTHEISDSKAFKKEWWDSRKKLDHQLGKLLASLERQLLGSWKGLLLGSYLDPCTRRDFSFMVQFVAEELMGMLASSSEAKPAEFTELARILLLGLLTDLTSEPLLPLIRQSSEDASNNTSSPASLLEDFVSAFLASALNNEQVTEASPSFASAYGGGSNSPRLTYLQTKLISQLVVKEARKFLSQHQRSDTTVPRQHIVLILDSGIHALPWECLPALSQQSVSRVPSLLYLSLQLSKLKATAPSSLLRDGISGQSVFYFLNPQLDLTNTQKRIQPWLESKVGWRGFTGTTPQAEQFEQALQSHHLILYFGHGSGREYVKSAPTALRNCGVMVLMGCSSGKLKCVGDLDPRGAPLDFLLSGSPCVVSNLWDVTDKDSDLLSQRLLSLWLEQQETVTATATTATATTTIFQQQQQQQQRLLPLALTHALPAARRACKLRYLTGAATVCYGLPIYVQSSLGSAS